MGNLVPLTAEDVKAFKEVTGVRPPRPKRRRAFKEVTGVRPPRPKRRRRRPPLPDLPSAEAIETFRRVREVVVPWETYKVRVGNTVERYTGAELIKNADALVAMYDAEVSGDEAAIDQAARRVWRVMGS